MKKKVLICAMLLLSSCLLFACGTSKKIDIANYTIEERNHLFSAQDEIYSLTLSTGLREKDYALDGIKNEMVDFSILSLTKLNGEPLSNDTYTYILTINEETHTGYLEKSEIDNSYNIDLGLKVSADDTINAKITFTGYCFENTMTNVSQDFTVNKQQALETANKELKKEIKDITADKNNKIETVIKIVKDYSTSEVKRYYWYVGVVSNNGDTLGILIDTNTGDVIAKKV